jgi:hypothetical protein
LLKQVAVADNAPFWTKPVFFTAQCLSLCNYSASSVWSCRYVKTQLNVKCLLCWRRHVSANVGHLQVMKMYMRKKNYTVWDNLEGVHILSCQWDLVNVRLTM